MHIKSGLCVHANGGSPADGVSLVFYGGCDQPRLKLDLYQLQGKGHNHNTDNKEARK